MPGASCSSPMELFGDHLEERFLERLALAKSNLPEHRDGAAIYAKFVKPAMVDPFKMAAHYAISSLFENYEENARIYSYTVAARAVPDHGSRQDADGRWSSAIHVARSRRRAMN